MTEDNDSSLDIDVSSLAEQITDLITGLEEMSEDEVMTCQISLTNTRGKNRLGVNTPASVATDVLEYIDEHVEEIGDNEIPPDTSVEIGEILISGDGTIVEAWVEDKYKK